METIIEIRELATEFEGRGEVKGFYFTQIAASEKAFVYEVTGSHRPHYEVFKKQINPPHPASEDKRDMVSYPKANSFGVWAWTYSDREKAMEKFYELSVIANEGE
jgi:hypothetical protein